MRREKSPTAKTSLCLFILLNSQDGNTITTIIVNTSCPHVTLAQIKRRCPTRRKPEGEVNEKDFSVIGFDGGGNYDVCKPAGAASGIHNVLRCLREGHGLGGSGRILLLPGKRHRLDPDGGLEHDAPKRTIQTYTPQWRLSSYRQPPILQISQSQKRQDHIRVLSRLQRNDRLVTQSPCCPCPHGAL